MAAGITVRREKLGALRHFFEAEAAQSVAKLRTEEALMIDGAVAAEGASIGLLEEVEQAGPFGAGNASPLFVLPRHRIVDTRVVGQNHLQLQVASPGGKRLKAIAFRAADSPLGAFLMRCGTEQVHLAGSLTANFWNGVKSVEFRVTDAAAP